MKTVRAPYPPAEREAYHLMGMFSPRTGAPSMISYFASVSLSFLAEVPVPVCSRLLISISMCFSFIRTCIPSRLSRKHRSIAYATQKQMGGLCLDESMQYPGNPPLPQDTPSNLSVWENVLERVKPMAN